MYKEIQLDCDPFDMNEADPSKTRALESCLWEFQVCDDLQTRLQDGALYDAHHPLELDADVALCAQGV